MLAVCKIHGGAFQKPFVCFGFQMFSNGPFKPGLFNLDVDRLTPYGEDWNVMRFSFDAAARLLHIGRIDTTDHLIFTLFTKVLFTIKDILTKWKYIICTGLAGHRYH